MYMQRMMTFALLLVSACSANQALAEIYRDFTPQVTIADIQQKYPQATIEALSPEWMTDNERLLRIQADNLPGSTLVAVARQTDAEVNEAIRIYQRLSREGASESRASYQRQLQYYQRYLTLSPEAQYQVKWVRWVPPAPLSLKQLEQQYGPAERLGYKEADNQVPFAEWMQKGVLANLDESRQQASSIEYYFTDADQARLFGVSTSPAAPVKNKRKRP